MFRAGGVGGAGATDVLSRYFKQKVSGGGVGTLSSDVELKLGMGGGGRGGEGGGGGGAAGGAGGAGPTNSSSGIRRGTPRVQTKHNLLEDNAGIEISGWRVTSTKLKMTDSIEFDQMPEAKDIMFSIPEIVFGRNSLKFEHGASGVCIDFNTLDALRSCLIETDPITGEPNRTIVKFALAEKWEERSRLLNINTAKQAGSERLDWTMTPVYYGTMERSGVRQGFREMTRILEEGESGIDYDRLRDTNAPILWYDLCEFYETELDDSGSGTLAAKVRVMPTCLFVLLRWWLRVDDSFVRLFDMRMFVDLNTNRVVFETSRKEMTYEELKKNNLPDSNKMYRDPNVFHEWLEEVEKEVRVMEL